MFEAWKKSSPQKYYALIDVQINAIAGLEFQLEMI